MTSEDLESIEPYQPFWENFNSTLRVDLKRFVIEIQLTEQRDFEFEIDKVLLAFRLFQICNVFCKIAWFFTDGKVTSVSIRDNPIQDRSTFWYIDMYQSPFKIEDMNKISQLLHQINEANLNERHALRIATERFTRSFSEHQLDEKIIDLCIGFEALMSKGKVRTNIGQYIGLGCATLLGEDQEQREDIEKFMIEAYRLRNKIVHGLEYSAQITIREKEFDIYGIGIQLQEILKDSIIEMIASLIITYYS